MERNGSTPPLRNPFVCWGSCINRLWVVVDCHNFECFWFWLVSSMKIHGTGCCFGSGCYSFRPEKDLIVPGIGYIGGSPEHHVVLQIVFRLFVALQIGRAHETTYMYLAG